MDNNHNIKEYNFDLLRNPYAKLNVAGLKYSLHGNVFQLGLLTLSALRAKGSGKNFYLITEAKEFEKFDDLVIDYGDSITLVQAKHSEKTDFYSKNDFLSKNGDASLAKYFVSWSIIRQLPYLKLQDGSLKKTKFIFFSNKKLKEMDKYIEKIHIENDEFTFPSPFTTPNYRIIQGKKRHDFIEKIREHSKPSMQENVNKKYSKKSSKKKKALKIKIKASNKEINQFLDQFIIKIAQPNVDQLFEIVRQEIGGQVNIGVQETYTGIIKFMLEWFKDMKTSVLTSEKFTNWNCLQNADLCRYLFFHYTKTFEEEFNDYLLDFKGFVNEKLLDFLKTAKSEQNVQIVVGINARPIVCVTIKELANLKRDEWIYIDYSDKTISDIEGVLLSHVIKFIVLNCQNVDIFTEQQIQGIGKLLKNRGVIKIIILTKNKIDLLAYLSKTTLQENLLEPPSDKQLQVLYNKHENKYITLAGKEYKIKYIIGQKHGGIYEIMKNLQYFSQITEHAHDDQVLVESGMPYGIYIENEMIYGEGYYDLSIIMRKTVSLYIIKGVDYNNLLEKLKTLFPENEERFAEIEDIDLDFEKWNKSEFVLLKQPDQFNNLISKGNNRKTYILPAKPSGFNEKSYLLLKSVKDFSTERFKVAKRQNNVYLPFAEGVDYSNRGLQKTFLKDISTGNQLSILLAPAGYGKTSFCKNIIDEHKKSECITRPVWVVNIPLPLLQFDNQGQPNLDPFLNINYCWQKDAFQADLHTKGMVLLILDSFDEVKNVKVVTSINNFFQNKLSQLKISCLVTTRPYASNKLVLPSKRLAIYKLTKYTILQQEEYIRKYITAILKTFKPSENALDDFVKKVMCISTTRLNKNSSKILGIPLESYLFCELLQPHVLDYVFKNANRVPDKCQINFKHLDISNTANLYQEFIRSKSILFLEKHIGVKSDNLYDKSMTFNLMGAYNHIMEMYALKQSFSIKEDISKYTKTINFEMKAFKTLEDTGLLKVSEHKYGARLNFNHETYQEFYSALAIIRGLLSEKGQFFDLVKKLVVQNCYDPKFHFIHSIIAQFSFMGGPMIPGYNKNRNLLSYWKAFGENCDVIGSGAVRVFNYCLAEFIEEEDEQNKTLKKQIKKQFQKQFKHFFRNIEKRPWAKYIEYVLANNQSRNQSGVNEDDNEENDLPIINAIDFVDTKCSNPNYSSVSHKSKFNNKIKLSDKGNVVLLEKETEKHKDRYDYWAINEGIEEIGYTGKLFSKPLADFLIKRAKTWSNNGKAAVLALREIYKSLTDEDIFAKNNCFRVLQKIILIVEYDNALDSLLHQANQEFINYLIMDLSSECLFLNPKNSKIKNQSIEYKILKRIPSILLVAEKLQYAVIFKDNRAFLVKEKQFEIKFGEGNQNKEFAKYILYQIQKINSEKYSLNSWKCLNMSNNFDDIVLNQVKFKLKIEKINLNDNEEFDSLIKDKGHRRSYTWILYEHLSENKLLNQNHVEYLERLWRNSDGLYNEFDSKKWIEWAGIYCIGYTGQYFNMQLANFLCEIKGSFKNQQKALENIFNTLTADNIDHDKLYHNAVQAYNYCAEKTQIFYRFELIQQSFGKRKLSDP